MTYIRLDLVQEKYGQLGAVGSQIILFELFHSAHLIYLRKIKSKMNTQGTETETGKHASSLGQPKLSHL